MIDIREGDRLKRHSTLRRSLTAQTACTFHPCALFSAHPRIKSEGTIFPITL
jgi:hypothetical protein